MSKLLFGLAALALVCSIVSAQPPPDASPDLSIPLTLSDCLSIAWQRHPDVAIARASAVAARANAREQASRRYPHLTAGWSVREAQSLGRSVNTDGVQSAGTRSTQRDAELSLTYTLYETGRSARIARARTSAYASEYGIANTHRLLAYEVTTAYYDLLAARRYANVAMGALANAQRHLQLVEERFNAGLVPRADLLPVKVEVAEARLDGIRAETDIKVATAALRALLGLPPAATFSLADTLPEREPPPELDELMALADQQRPDLAEQKLGVQAANLSLRATQAEAGLTWEAAASAGYGRYTGTTGDTWQLSLGAAYPLFDAGAADARVTAAHADATSAQLRLDALKLDIQKQVEQAFHRIHQATAAIDAAAIGREDAQNSLAAAEAKYTEGLAIVIEVTDAQLALLRAEVAEIQARYDSAIAYAALDNAIGNNLPPAAGDNQ
jgi:outer membrane protein